MTAFGSPDTDIGEDDTDAPALQTDSASLNESLSSAWDQARLDFAKHGYTVSDEQWPVIVNALRNEKIPPDQLIEKVVQWHNEFGKAFPGFVPGKEAATALLMEGFHNLNAPIPLDESQES